jgi:hypothetical protein
VPRSITIAHCPDDFAGGHPLAFKSRTEYWNCYGEGILEALRTTGIPLNSPTVPQYSFTAAFNYDDRPIRLGICYSDRGPDPTDWPEVDGILAMKWHPARKRAFEMPIFPAGFPLTVDQGHSGSRAFRARLSELRALRDGVQIDDLMFNRFYFRTVGHVSPENYPKRLVFAEALAGHRYSHGGIMEADKWHTALATHRWCLNLCGSGNSIDRKVPIMCAIGSAIISDRGLEDLELPWGGRFVHGENIWFVDGPKDLPKALSSISGEMWRRLVDGSRKLYDECLSAEARGAWYLKCAGEVGGRK